MNPRSQMPVYGHDRYHVILSTEDGCHHEDEVHASDAVIAIYLVAHEHACTASKLVVDAQARRVHEQHGP